MIDELCLTCQDKIRGKKKTNEMSQLPTINFFNTQEAQQSESSINFDRDTQEQTKTKETAALNQQLSTFPTDGNLVAKNRRIRIKIKVESH